MPPVVECRSPVLVDMSAFVNDNRVLLCAAVHKPRGCRRQQRRRREGVCAMYGDVAGVDEVECVCREIGSRVLFTPMNSYRQRHFVLAIKF